ncbi:hypothetical protein BCR34DRAFT_557180 [Clohesyomyces aquaticus]|uniref:Uncharacterized protein n=1 Tax=Clohesyomyces aquaticus TaxID=1231657 RepID=A0A1Y2A1N3_9PLEO|nr:hypothetical protein BCR34DRAFT_557180 [Clohesyomyces aquaticus]
MPGRMIEWSHKANTRDTSYSNTSAPTGMELVRTYQRPEPESELGGCDSDDGGHYDFTWDTSGEEDQKDNPAHGRSARPRPRGSSTFPGVYEETDYSDYSSDYSYQPRASYTFPKCRTKTRPYEYKYEYESDKNPRTRPEESFTGTRSCQSGPPYNSQSSRPLGETDEEKKLRAELKALSEIGIEQTSRDDYRALRALIDEKTQRLAKLGALKYYPEDSHKDDEVERAKLNRRWSTLEARKRAFREVRANDRRKEEKQDAEDREVRELKFNLPQKGRY